MDLSRFGPILARRPEIAPESLAKDLETYYLPFVEKITRLPKGSIIGISAIQGAGKTTQGEILTAILSQKGFKSISLSIDDHYITHQELLELQNRDPRYIARGVTHDIGLAVENLKQLQTMEDGQEITIARYDKGAYGGQGERFLEKVSVKPDYIFYDGWMLGARPVADESIFTSGLPSLERPEDQQFARDINKKLADYEPLWQHITFMAVLYVPHYQISLDWRDQAEERLRQEGRGMSHDQIVEFVHYFWRSVHPAIQIKNLAEDKNTDLVVTIGDDHAIMDIKWRS